MTQADDVEKLANDLAASPRTRDKRAAEILRSQRLSIIQLTAERDAAWNAGRVAAAECCDAEAEHCLPAAIRYADGNSAGSDDDYMAGSHGAAQSLAAEIRALRRPPQPAKGIEE
jgi:hypothetical protein